MQYFQRFLLKINEKVKSLLIKKTQINKQHYFSNWVPPNSAVFLLKEVFYKDFFWLFIKIQYI